MSARILSLCSGYLGLDMAVESVLDAHTVAVSDIDPGAAKILAHRAPDVPNLGDVKTICWEDWAGVEIMTAGYPCQPFSHAGKRAGTDDPRHIFPFIADGIRRVGPRLVVLENVRGHLRLGFDVVLGTLADIGYDAQWVCLRASDVGACHKRERLFIVATPADADAATFGARHPGSIEPVSFLAPDRAERRGQAPRDGRFGGTSADAELGGRTTGPNGPDGLTLLPTPAVNDMESGKTVEGPSSLSIEALRLLKTPTAQLAVNGGSQHPDKRKSGGHGPTLADEVEHLLPTPRATDGTKGGPNQRGSSGDLMMPSAVHQDWSVYEAAIRRHEAMLGRPAPSPTETGPKGGARLSPVFVEWMMACPDGWVTDPAIGLTRNEQLKALGNGVVAPQAAEALRFMLARQAQVAA